MSRYHYTFGHLTPEIQEHFVTGRARLTGLEDSIRAFLSHFPRVPAPEKAALVDAVRVAENIYGRCAAEVLDSLMVTTKEEVPDVE